jgi:hypothetical protein
MRTLIRKALRPKPEQRFGTASEFADALGRIELPFDWETSISATGEITWRARRPASPDMVILLEQDGATWRVRSYTEKAPSPRRALGRGVYWCAGMQRGEALEFLEDVFRAVEGG